jgi:glutamyl/glutaminyl-tRNA synthetase
LVPILKERATTFGEARSLLSGELSFVFSSPNPAPERLKAKALADAPEGTKDALEALLGLIEGLAEGVTPEAVKEALMPMADAAEATQKGGRGSVLWPLRYALSGADRSPDPFALVSILGPAESAARVRRALDILS